MNLGVTELLIILGLVLLLFGTTRVPKLARSLGQASKEFKKGVSEGPSDEDGPETESPETESPEKTEPKALGRETTKKPASPSST